MLDIQRTFHCYNSARMSAALLELEMGIDVGHLARTCHLAVRLNSTYRMHADTPWDLASRSCLDLMNESFSPDISDEDKQKLVEWLHENPAKRKRSGIWKRTIPF